jgi:hypothetical protein
MTPVLLLTFLLALDVLVLLGWSHDSRDGRDWQPRGQRSPERLGLAGFVPLAAALAASHLPAERAA